MYLVLSKRTFAFLLQPKHCLDLTVCNLFGLHRQRFSYPVIVRFCCLLRKEFLRRVWYETVHCKMKNTSFKCRFNSLIPGNDLTLRFVKMVHISPNKNCLITSPTKTRFGQQWKLIQPFNAYRLLLESSALLAFFTIKRASFTLSAA